MSTTNRDSSNLIKRKRNAVLAGYKSSVSNTTVRVNGASQNPGQSSAYVVDTKLGAGECCNGYPRACGGTTGNYHECNPGGGC